MENQTVTIIGGTGFVGAYVVRSLAKAGYRLRVVSRNPEAALALKTAGDLGQIALLPGDLAKPESLVRHLQGAYAVVNLVGILFESGRQRFAALHAQGAEKLAQAAHALEVKHFIHMSSLGVDHAGASQYARTKAIGEKAVRAAFPESVILRPSVIFGAEDNFLNKFARLSCVSPALPLIGGGKTLFQPVYVGDVAEAIKTCIEAPAAAGKTFELGGPEVMSFRQVLEYILRTVDRRRILAPVPFPLAGLIAAFTEYMPDPFKLTRDQVRLLKYDNIVERGALTFATLGMHPQPLDLVAPDYLARYRKGGAHA